MKTKILIILFSFLISLPCFAFKKNIQNVVVAARDIKAPVRLQIADIAVIEAEPVSPQTVIINEDSAMRTLLDNYVLEDISKGEQIKDNFLRAVSQAEPNWRKYVLPVDGETAEIFQINTARNISFADIIIVLQDKALTLLQKVKIDGLVEENGQYALVLFISPGDAQFLLLAQQTASSVKVLPRAGHDTVLIPVPVTTLPDLAGGAL